MDVINDHLLAHIPMVPHKPDDTKSNFLDILESSSVVDNAMINLKRQTTIEPPVGSNSTPALSRNIVV